MQRKWRTVWASRTPRPRHPATGIVDSLGCGAITTPPAGKVAIVDRGSCSFAVKAKNAQNAGASGVIVANNQTVGGADQGAIGFGGADASITIPAIGIGTANGRDIKAAISGVNTEFFTDPTRLAGTEQGFVRLYAPTTVALGSSISHYDIVATPNC